MRRAGAAVVLAGVLALAGCGAGIPTDPDGTLSRAAGGELRVGYAVEPGLVDGPGEGDPSGPVVDVVREYAASIDADIAWTAASEESLVTDLEEGAIDVAIGGFTDQTPWSDRASVTRGFFPGAERSGPKSAILVPLGENALLTSIETHLDGEGLT